jgi:hypothetical protein
MFAGALPKDVLRQVSTVLPLEKLPLVYVCATGSFLIEQLCQQLGAKGRIVSSDVSLVTSALGTLRATGSTLPFTFKDDFAFVDELVGDDGARRVAALLVIGQMSKHLAKNDHAATHLAHYRLHFAGYLERTRERVLRLLESFHLDAFVMRDFLEHAAEGVRKQAAIIAFPRGPERLPRLIDMAISWTPPPSEPWEPAELADWVKGLEASSVPFCVGTDRELAGVSHVGMFEQLGRKKPLYLFASAGSAYSRQEFKLAKFRYRPIEPEKIGKRSVLKMVPATAEEMNFLKERYMQKGIRHTPGKWNYLVFVDDMLVGGVIYIMHETINVHADFCVSRERRLSKLVALVATSAHIISQFERRMLIKWSFIETTVWTEKAISMKYRGVYTLFGRREPSAQTDGKRRLIYHSVIRPQSPQELFHEWFRNNASENAARRSQASRPRASA